MTTVSDIAILGGGPGGYVAALRAAQLGARVVLIEEKDLGGVCLNVGCIPTKALLRSAEVLRQFQKAKSFGIKLDGSVKPDWRAIQARKGRVVKQLVRGVEMLLSRAGVQVIHARGKLSSTTSLQAETAEGMQEIETHNVVIATGSRPMQLPIPGMELPGVIDSTGALDLESLPERLLIIGGGVIGCEFAEIFSALGTRVTVVEMLDRLLPLMDRDLGQALAPVMKKRKVQTLLDSRVTRIDSSGDALSISIATENGVQSVEVDRVLVAVGRRPNVEDIGLEAVGLRFEKSGIPVNAQCRTNLPNVFAVGDVSGVAQLAHVASMMGEVAVENALGHEASFNLKTNPSCVYTDPEIASVGLSEEQARDANYAVRVGTFPLSANGKALTYGERTGFVKVVGEDRYGEVLGLHIFAPHASDLIHEGALALALEATVDEFISTIHGHPTQAEAVREAMLQLRDGALHLPR
jgi:dihydrolipoamide dehydrogenase